MSIIIKGMKIPTSPVLFCIHPDGKVLADLEGGWREYKSVPVPPHGRLIDADALEEEPCDVVEDRDWYSVFGYSHDQIRYAPTVIEAEEGERE